MTTKQDFFRSTTDLSLDLKANKQTRNAQAQKGKIQRKANNNKHKK
ncbi:hypothetical protein Ga0466249_001702 [Sporomusaceae bacterium BoRhaA]|nr:hypothetical protein [Pelorhabdus rhamnosifermentans]MBU2700610.1 hypothetical protein [Pelorhabdus rhamnosifermentans]